jgi:GSH-dependent disulfide-bond oxidoreductase
LPYEVHELRFNKNEQKAPEYLAINPNGRIPAIVDRNEGNFAVFESGAILMYLAAKAGKLMPGDRKGGSLVTQWLMFQMGGIGPMMGQANVFLRYFPQKIPPAIERYQKECQHLAGDYSIADIANWCWVRTHRWSGIEIDDLVHLSRWRDTIAARPACIRGVAIPRPMPQLVEGTSPEADRLTSSARSILMR